MKASSISLEKNNRNSFFHINIINFGFEKKKL